jgi:hypothetical protein
LFCSAIAGQANLPAERRGIFEKGRSAYSLLAAILEQTDGPVKFQGRWQNP